MEKLATGSGRPFNRGMEASLVAVTVSLLLVSALCVGVVRARRPSLPSAMKVVARLQLEPHRALYLVEIEGRRLVIGAGDAPISMVAELGPAPPATVEAPAPSFLKRVLG